MHILNLAHSSAIAITSVNPQVTGECNIYNLDIITISITLQFQYHHKYTISTSPTSQYRAILILVQILDIIHLYVFTIS